MGNVIDFVEYFAESPWPNVNGNGYYLELISLDLNNALPSIWKASNSNLNGFDKSSDNDYVIYPNPVTNRLNIVSTNIINQISLFDISGKMILNENLYSKKTQLVLSSLSIGVYFLRVNEKTELKNFKIIKK